MFQNFPLIFRLSFRWFDQVSDNQSSPFPIPSPVVTAVPKTFGTCTWPSRRKFRRTSRTPCSRPSSCTSTTHFHLNAIIYQQKAIIFSVTNYKVTKTKQDSTKLNVFSIKGIYVFLITLSSHCPITAHALATDVMVRRDNTGSSDDDNDNDDDNDDDDSD